MSFYCAPLPYQPCASRYYAALADLPWAIWLDSGGMARYDILVAAPQHKLIIDEGEIDPFALLRGALGEPVAPVADMPFAGGALGYWSYDLARRMMVLPNGRGKASDKNSCHARSSHSTTRPLGEEIIDSLREPPVNPATGQMPDMAVGIYDWAVVLDHRLHAAYLVSHRRFVETASLLPLILRRLQNCPPLPADTFRVHGQITSNFTQDSYAAAFVSVQNYLRAGDCYQINLAQRFSAKAAGDAFGAYLALRSMSPAPYSAFMNLPYGQILCASPECFVSVRNGKVTTKPIKGTRPRGRDVQHDLLLAEELRSHAKDRAENLMIVDLLRNDLGRNCIPGSVRVPEMFKVESFANVHHLVSTVEGRLLQGRDALDVLRDCFPGGSVTGAPKLRAMQIIEQLEPDRRGIYCGAIGYAGFDGNMDSNIAIRTLVYVNNLLSPLAAQPGNAELAGEIHCWAGGGIVADSELAAEYQETLYKASAMLELLQRYGGMR